MAEQFSGPFVFSPGDPNARSSSAEVPVGTVAYTPTGAWMYVLAAIDIASGEPVEFDDNGATVTPVVTGAYIGAPEDPISSGEYGWIRTRGQVNAVVASGVTEGDVLKAVSGEFDASTDDYGGAIALDDSDGTTLVPIYLRG